jgi:hypothetical protein
MKFRKPDWEYHVTLSYYESTQSVSMEDLYQAFKKRMQHEARMARDARDAQDADADRDALNEALGWGAQG